MGGTDLHDQFNKYYRTTVRCNKWPIKIFTHFITSCVTVVWGALPDIADTQVDDLLQTDQSVNEEYCPATIL